MKNKRIWKMSVLLFIVALLLVACSGTKKKEVISADTNFSIMKDPVELHVLSPQTNSTLEPFIANFGYIITEKYPNISFKFTSFDNMSLSELIASNTPVDIIYYSTGSIPSLLDADLLDDSTELAKKYKLNLSNINKVAMDTINQIDGGKLMALPNYINTYITFYNKDLFDRFGVSYPKDQMTWDETYDLAKRMTRMDNGVQYQGFSYYFLTGGFLEVNPYGEQWYDPKTKKVTLADGRWPAILRNFERFHQIPGNPFVAGQAALDMFAKDQRIAMQITLSNRIAPNSPHVAPNWDIVSFPVFPDNPGVGAGAIPFLFSVGKNSKHKDEAFLAIASMLTNEAQTKLLQTGRLPAVDLPNPAELYAKEIITMKGRNVNALIANKYGPAIPRSKEVSAVQTSLGSAMTNVLNGKKDVNTALREATEDANKRLEALKEAK